MNFIRKILLNYGFNSLKTLGIYNYIKLLIYSFVLLPKILVSRKLDTLDDFFNELIINFDNQKLKITIKKINKEINEFDTFSLIREIFIRNVYLKFFKIESLRDKYCLDLGSNRGIFSLQAGKIFKKVISIEMQEKYKSNTNYTQL